MRLSNHIFQSLISSHFSNNLKYTSTMEFIFVGKGSKFNANSENGIKCGERFYFLYIISFELLALRILTRKKQPKIKLQRLRKKTNIDIWVVGTSN